MIHKRTLDALEFGKIRAYLSSFCQTEAGKKLALEISPFPTPHDVQIAFEFYNEAVNFFSQPSGPDNKPFVIAPYPELTGSLNYYFDQANQDGTANSSTRNPDIETFWALREMLHSAREANSAINISDAGRLWPNLFHLATESPFPEQLAAALDRCISDDCLFRDESTPELYRLRTELRNLHRTCLSKVKDFAKQYNMQQYLQDDFMTISSDRYVLPLKANFKGRMQGVIHDWSQTGETCYFEPIFLVEINNRLQELKHEEREEERKILQYLAGMLTGNLNEVQVSITLLATLDFLKAKIMLAESLQCNCVNLVNAKEGISLLHARHPLLELSRNRNKSSDWKASSLAPVQPIDILLRPGEKALIITGGNAGGKTVCLKTFGLVAAMTLSGLPAPIDKGSHMPWLSRMDAFIGDEQSLDDNVSTFTAQIDHLAKAWKHLGENTMLLLDEFGSGTDPAEGSALAQAVLDSLLEKDCFVLSATHFPSLKSYALTKPAVRAATMLFDSKTNKPLFKIAYDQVGSSQALAIAKEHGLPADIIEKAERYLLQDGGDTSSIMAKLNDLAIRREEEVEHLRIEQARYKNLVNLQKEKFDKEKSRLHDEISARSKELMQAYRQNRLSAKQAIREMNTLKANLVPDNIPPDTSVLPQATDLKVGQEVFHSIFQKRGIITDIDARKNRVRLDMNGVNIWADKNDLLQSSSSNTTKKTVSEVLLAAKGNPEKILSLTLDVRGQRAVEAIAQTEKYIDRAVMEGYGCVEIIHGRGTGALRREIHEFLHSSPIVANVQLAPEDRGGDGMTIVELK